MPATLGVVGADSVLKALLESRRPVSEPMGVNFFAIPELTDPTPVAASADLTIVNSIAELATKSDVVLVATEPAGLMGVLKSLAAVVAEGQILIVLSAHTTLEELRLVFGPGPKLLRSLLDQDRIEDGIFVVCAEPGLEAEDVERAVGAVGRVGVVELVSEDSLDAAYAVMVVAKECLVMALAGIEDGAVEAGLPRDMARSFVRQTAMATALLLEDHPGSPADLKDQVASPGGTTIAGLAVLEDQGVRGAFIRAVEAAVLNAREGQDGERSRVVE